MGRGRWDVLWFMAALGLLAAGLFGWWRADPSGYTSMHPSGLLIAVWASGGIVLFAWWRRSAAPEGLDARLMGPLALAASGPLSLLPLVRAETLWDPVVGAVAGLVVLPLGWCLAELLPSERGRGRVRLAVVLAAGVATVLGIAVPMDYPGGIADLQLATARWMAGATVSVLPALAVALVTLRGDGAARLPAARRLVDSFSVLVIGVAPAVTALCLLLSGWQLLVLPAVAVIVTLLVLGRFALQPLAGLAGVAQTQRDRVVAAADAERLRLASVLHDGPLADITLLIQRLDDRGDADSAAAARSIASELRAIGSELRLPVLDDLGAGPALEWLVGRLAGRSGVPIGLDHLTVQRPPGPVELAMYRVAQEAVVNALKHGSPPIRVAYRATPGAAELRVEDSGPGIPADASARAEREGRLGMASMTQRAEAIDARLMVAARPQGGTRVELVWRAAAPRPGLVDAAPISPTAAGVARARP
jgi:signal transduction histidine kinase